MATDQQVSIERPGRDTIRKLKQQLGYSMTRTTTLAAHALEALYDGGKGLSKVIELHTKHPPTTKRVGRPARKS